MVPIRRVAIGHVDQIPAHKVKQILVA
jgi:hypothetical protein